ncbi:1-deoxy-D-xylulose 5-phosphate reductoisomerase [Thermoanaerobaculum aquaticum]|uniref:1-deoxy-D-xylulose 5-phosphate reductoisomerase n=1 Tax=Thermoanaerobaculum aquaticum TaxID=1312852 RepID=A0A062XR85_9BACT|nr:1-deoxy-D-xylulose-5-phosphate reductoisomerase [Thermoanaerobaculum aquaticum]KDA53323.1 1-deoxy-D-xylulose 5-phosphate reductoisomerase [Thermoanaerobaculum aquaticum]
MKVLSILGSTGSIGTSTLDVVRHFPDRFQVVALAAGRNLELLARQIEEFRPQLVAVADEEKALTLAHRFPGLEVLAGEEGRLAVATHPQATTVVGALVGALGLPATYAAVQAGKELLLANKETLVVAGSLIMAEARRSGSQIIPVDSEHNGLFQALRVGPPGTARRLILTASGGPFRTTPLAQLANVTPEQALAHPTWRMGAKISVDSATMMNKGLEIIEAHHLFGFPPDAIDVLIHPESRIHALVEYMDGTLIAQLSVNDMRFPILYALAYPERLASPFGRLDLAAVGSLHFELPDDRRFPCLALARQALQAGGTAPAVLNAANEVAVELFLAGQLPFLGIPELVRRVLEEEPAAPLTSLEEALAADQRARRRAREWAARLAR